MTAVWREPVRDRSAADVAAGNSKGVLNAADMQRMEDNLHLLMTEFAGADEARRVWRAGDLLYEADMRRLAYRLEMLLAAGWRHLGGFLPPCVPDVPALPLNSWQGFNEVEELLFQMWRLDRENRAEKAFAGELFAGCGIGVL